MPQPSEPFHADIFDAFPAQTLAQLRLAVLGVVPRSGNGAHVDDGLNLVCMKDSNKFFDGPRRVADGIEDDQIAPFRRNASSSR